MEKKCIYCKKQLDENDVIDVCQLCGYKVWGSKMYEAIKENMVQAKEDGDLFQGSVTDTFTKSTLNSRREIKNPKIDLVGFNPDDKSFSLKTNLD